MGRKKKRIRLAAIRQRIAAANGDTNTNVVTSTPTTKTKTTKKATKTINPFKKLSKKTSTKKTDTE
jgi:hypothetical protein